MRVVMTEWATPGHHSGDLLIHYDARAYPFGPYERRIARGSCTVWHSYPDGVRYSTAKESKFCDIWQREKWRAEDAEKSRS